MSFKESADKIMPGLDELSDFIRRLGSDMNTRMFGLQKAVESQAKNEELRTLHNMRRCVRTAADVVSSASTVMARDDKASVIALSDFQDILPQEPNETMLRWISESSGDGYSETPLNRSESKTSYETKHKSASVVLQEESDSDGEIDAEIVQLQLSKGRKELKSGNLETAERFLNSGFMRLKGGSSRFFSNELRLQVLQELADTYRQQEKWAATKLVMVERLSILSRDASNVSQHLQETMDLASILLKLNDIVQARMYARKCVKAYRKLGEDGYAGLEDSLRIMMVICHADGEAEEEEAYSMMLSNVLEKTGQASLAQTYESDKAADTTVVANESPGSATDDLPESDQPKDAIEEQLSTQSRNYEQ